LLADNDGRMKQANIVEETGWSNAKVSQLLSSMDEDGRIEKLRIGRENLISFPDDESEDA
ncbi:MAG: helix-turn-helix domain-containing protein, partial [Halapricum sp.]